MKTSPQKQVHKLDYATPRVRSPLGRFNWLDLVQVLIALAGIAYLLLWRDLR